MISLILIILAAMCNVVMDNVEPYRIGATKLPKTWNKGFQGKKIGGWKLDVWHVCKSAMLLMLLAATMVYRPIIHLSFTALGYQFHYVDYVLYGVVWCVVFNAGYNFLKLKK